MAEITKGLGTKIAKMPGLQPVLQAVASEVLARAIANAGAHADTSAYVSSLHVIPARGRNGVMDRLVVADDPAAVHIEYGHVAPSEKGGTWVPGQFILTNAIRGA